MIELEEKKENELEDLKAEWEGLLEGCPDATPFQFPQWIIPWWRNFGGSVFKMPVMRCEGKLAGLVPLFIYKTETGKKKLCFTGTGISDYLDLVAVSGKRKEVTGVFVKYLLKIAEQWDEIDLQDIPEGSPLLRAEFPESLCFEKSRWSVCPYLDLPESSKSLEYRIPKKLRNNIRSASKGLLQLNEYRMEKAESGNVGLFLGELFRLHGKRWESRNQSGVLNSSQLRDFYLQSAPELLASGLLRLYTLRCGDSAVACYYVLVHAEKAYAYLGGFDPAFAQYCPGSLALFNVISDSIDNGITVFDFMRGAEAYKYYWRPAEKYNYRIRVLKK